MAETKPNDITIEMDTTVAFSKPCLVKSMVSVSCANPLAHTTSMRSVKNGRKIRFIMFYEF